MCFNNDRLVHCFVCLRLKKHGLNSWVTVGHRDVISDGFDVEKPADAVFLDLPKPWEVVPHVQRSLKRGKIYFLLYCL